MKLFIAAAFVAISPLLLSVQTAGAAEEIDGIAVDVNGEKIKKSDVRRAVQAQRLLLERQLTGQPELLKQKIAELERETLETMIDRELIVKEFKDKMGGSIKKQYVDDDINKLVQEQFEGDRSKFIAHIESRGMSIGQFEKLREEMIIVQFMRHSKTKNLPPITPAEVERVYEEKKDELRDNSDDKINLYSISIPAFAIGKTKEDQQALAEDLRKKLVAGADFAATAKAYSQDSKAEDGGAWGWVTRDGLNKVLAEKAFQIASKTVGPVIEDGQYFRILYVEARVLTKAKTLDEVRQLIERYAEQERAKKVQDDWLKHLRKDAVIRRF